MTSPTVQASTDIGRSRTSPLGDLISTEPWVAFMQPFPHLYAPQVFQPDVYTEIAFAFRSYLDLGVSERAQPGRFARIFRGYDAHGMRLPLSGGPLDIFLRRDWNDFVATRAGVKTTGHLNAELHHHQAGSSDGRVHNDMNPGWFARDPAPGEVVLADDRCDYKSGTITSRRQPGWTATKTIRAVSILFYLDNDGWQEGDGGETALYRYATRNVCSFEKKVAPISNSLIAFECTPFSFHTFLRCRTPRNALVMWLHRSQQDVIAKWGPGAVTEWPALPKS